MPSKANQRGQQFLDARGTIVGVLRHRVQHECLELAGHTVAERRRLFELELVEHRRQIPARERLAPGQDVIEHRARGEDVGPRVHRLAARLLGRHVIGRAQHRAGRGHARIDEAGHAEIENLQQPVALHEQVARLQIAVHDALPVRRRQSLAHLNHEIELAFERGGLRTLQIRGERHALEQLHRDEGAPLILPGIEDRDDVRMQQAGGGLRLAVEARAGVGIALEIGHQHLQRDRAVR